MMQNIQTQDMAISQIPMQKTNNFSTQMLKESMDTLSGFPLKLRVVVENLSNSQLDTVYHENGWTIRQFVHHCADSHMNHLIRLKRCLTEDQPIIKPYFESKWAELPDSKIMPVGPSLRILEGIQERWGVLKTHLSDTELTRSYFNPDTQKYVELASIISIFAWHCQHHLLHINLLKKRMNWW